MATQAYIKPTCCLHKAYIKLQNRTPIESGCVFSEAGRLYSDGYNKKT